jgi:hypothetical protein
MLTFSRQLDLNPMLPRGTPNFSPAHGASSPMPRGQTPRSPQRSVDQTIKAEDEEIRNYLLELDALRQQCERQGDFLKAQECVNKMREVNLRNAKRVELRSHQLNAVEKRQIAEQHKLELLTFSKMWEEKLHEYDQRASLLVHDMKKHHTEEYKSQEGMLKLQLMNKRPRFSKNIMDLRAFLQKLIALRNYIEAEDVKRKLAQLEEAELHMFDDNLAVQFEKKAQAMKGQFVNEINAVMQKIETGREELLAQRRIDFDRLVKRHANELRERDAETKLHVAKTRQYIHQQVKAFVKDPLKTGMDLRGISRSSNFGPAGSARRARTPPVGSAGRKSRDPNSSSLLVSDEFINSRYGWDF